MEKRTTRQASPWVLVLAAVAQERLPSWECAEVPALPLPPTEGVLLLPPTYRLVKPASSAFAHSQLSGEQKKHM